MKFMIGQPMNGLSAEEIKTARQAVVEKLTAEGHTIINTHFVEDWKTESGSTIKNKPLYFLSRALMRMAACDGVVFIGDWKAARGCRMEYEVAKAYGLTIRFEEQL